jgi:hypothetical protein
LEVEQEGEEQQTALPELLKVLLDQVDLAALLLEVLEEEVLRLLYLHSTGKQETVLTRVVEAEEVLVLPEFLALDPQEQMQEGV